MKNKINENQLLIIIFFITRSLFLGSGTSLIINVAKQDSLFGTLFGIIGGISIIYLNYFLIKSKYSFHELLNKYKVNGIIIKVLMIILASFIINQTLLMLKTYISSFYLTKSPNLFLIIPIIILVIIICKNGIHVLGKVAELILPINIILYLIVITTLVPLIKFNNYLPMLNTNIFELGKCALCFATMSSIPILIMNEYKLNPKKVIISYSLSTIFSISFILICIGVMGVKLSTIFRFPEFMVLKNISIFNFIEKLENIIALFWIFDIFITISMCSLFIKSIIDHSLKNIKIRYALYIIFIIQLFIIDSTYLVKHFNIIIYIYNYLPYILLSFFLAICTPLIIKKIKLKS